MNKPNFFYRIWHGPRVGSSLLCQLLTDTGIAGSPGEHVTLHGHETLRQRYGIEDYDQLKKQVWSIGRGNNGVFGVKLSYHKHDSDKIIEDLARAKGISIPKNHEVIWQDFFPNSKNIVITRLDKVAQAVSWWKAIQDNEWHLTSGQKRKTPKSFYEDKYDIDALNHLFLEAMLREAATIDYLKANNQRFKTIAYEDLVADPQRIINEILHYLGLISIPLESLPPMKYLRTANKHSEEWILRFRRDMQQGMEKKIW